jgi:hypothetical protein
MKTYDTTKIKAAPVLARWAFQDKNLVRLLKLRADKGGAGAELAEELHNIYKKRLDELEVMISKGSK